MDKLNPDQREAVTLRNTPILVFAGPGTGKTLTIVERIAALIREGVDPDQILAITFTNKASQEMINRILALTGKRLAWARTIHGACAQILRDYIQKLGYPSAFQIASLDFARKILKEIIGEMKLSEIEMDISKLARKISSRKASGISHDIPEKDKDPIFEQIFAEYQDKMKSKGYIDFDDLVYLTLKLCLDDPEILKELQSQWQHIIVDEFQDCDLSQYALISLLGRGKEIVAVGDDDQSIYSFRSSTPKVLQYFSEDFKPEIIILKTSYRLPRSIQKAANELIEHNETRFEKTLTSKKDAPGVLEVHGFGSEAEEGEFVADMIKTLLTEGIKPEDIGVIARRHAELSRAEMALKHLDIPTRKTGERSFYEFREVRDILAYITVIALPQNTPALERVLKLDPGIPSVGSESVTDLLEDLSEQNDVSLYEAIEIAVSNGYVVGKPQKCLMTLLEGISKLQEQMTSLCISGLMREAAKIFNYAEKLKKISNGEKNYKKRIEHLKDLAKIADQFEIESGSSVINFLNEMAIAAIQGGVSKENKEIRLTTLHGAKGLEYEVVFLMGASQGNLPHLNGDIEEERRLMYVGITRAKEKLFISHARYIGNKVKPRSLFIDELGVIPSKKKRVEEYA